jgi:hypothetical protein
MALFLHEYLVKKYHENTKQNSSMESRIRGVYDPEKLITAYDKNVLSDSALLSQ